MAARAWLTVIAVIGLGACEETTVAVSALDPPYGPTVGGTVTTIRGQGFESVPGLRPTVLFGGRPVPFVAVVRDDELTVLVPPASEPGDVDVVVVVGERAARVEGGFRYSAPPVIDEVTPRDVLYIAGTTQVQIDGRGFLDEGAGPPVVLLDGQPIEVTVESDTRLTFVAPGGIPLREPTLQLVNQRGGDSLTRAFRYVPSMQPGLLLFGDNGTFATYLDPVTGRTADIPFQPIAFIRVNSVVRDENGEYWAVDRARRLGTLDFSEQALTGPVGTETAFPAIERVGDTLWAIEDRSSRRLGRLSPDGTFTPLPGLPPLRCCGSHGLAFDGQHLYYSDRGEKQEEVWLHRLDPATGERGPSVQVEVPPRFAGEPPPIGELHLEELRFFQGTLYAGNRSGELLTIDPATGGGVVVPFTVGRARAITSFE